MNLIDTLICLLYIIAKWGLILGIPISLIILLLNISDNVYRDNDDIKEHFFCTLFAIAAGFSILIIINWIQPHWVSPNWNSETLLWYYEMDKKSLFQWLFALFYQLLFYPDYTGAVNTLLYKIGLIYTTIFFMYLGYQNSLEIKNMCLNFWACIKVLKYVEAL